MLGHGLTCTETSGNCSSTALCNWEKGVQDTLSCNQRYTCREALVGRSGNTDWPFLCQCQILGGSVCKLDRYDGFQNCVFSVSSRMDYGSLCQIGRNHGFMQDGVSLLGLCDNGSRSYYIPFFYCNMCVPFFLCVKGVYADTTGNIFT